MNSVVDEVLNTSATDNKIKYRITHSDNTTEDVQIDLITPVTTAGTPLNKVLFDSIQADLNTRLLISSKATTNDAQTGTNDTRYMTALKTKQSVQQFDRSQEIFSETGTQSGTTAKTIYTFGNNLNSVVHIHFYGYAEPYTPVHPNQSIFTVNGTNMTYVAMTLNDNGNSTNRYDKVGGISWNFTQRQTDTSPKHNIEPRS